MNVFTIYLMKTRKDPGRILSYGSRNSRSNNGSIVVELSSSSNSSTSYSIAILITSLSFSSSPTFFFFFCLHIFFNRMIIMFVVHNAEESVDKEGVEDVKIIVLIIVIVVV
jgi:hypothetical protein